MVNPVVQANGAAVYAAQQMQFFGIPSAAAMPESQFFLEPAVCESQLFYHRAACESHQAKSGLTCNISAPRKRSRDSFDQFNDVQSFATLPQKSNCLAQMPSSAGDDMCQFEIDAIISQHTKRMRLELEERQKHQARLLAAAIREGVMKKLREKDEHIQRMSKLNLVLQERLKSLYVENQLWRDLAQSNEATANSLRTNLEHVLQQIGSEERISAVATVVEEDVESCCGSSNGVGDAKNEEDNSCYGDRSLCRICKQRESCVLLLPCRHLCLCNICGSGPQQLQSCPVCNASMNATLHVNMS